jgi:hypothetical protein
MSKKISVDPIFLKVRSSSLKKSKAKFNSQQNISMNRIRKRILNQLNKKSSRHEKVKSQHNPQETETEPVINNGDKRVIDNFSDSMNYLNKETRTVAKQKFNKQNKVTPTEMNDLNIKNTKPKTTPIFENVNLELPDELKEPQFTINSSVPITQEGGRLNKTLKNNEPKYGCLKKGTKPTFSKHYNKTIKNRIQFSTDLERTEPETCQQNIESKLKSHKISSNVASNVDMTDVTEEIAGGDNINVSESSKPDESFEMKTNSLINTITETNTGLETNKTEKNDTDGTITETRETKPTGNTKQSGKKRKEILGKNKQTSKVSLIINNNKTRRKIRQEHMVLNTTPISYIKKVLKEKGLLEVGSRAPEDVLRSMYTNAKLTGDIENRNGEVLINNYMNDDSIVV